MAGNKACQKYNSRNRIHFSLLISKYVGDMLGMKNKTTVSWLEQARRGVELGRMVRTTYTVRESLKTFCYVFAHLLGCRGVSDIYLVQNSKHDTTYFSEMVVSFSLLLVFVATEENRIVTIFHVSNFSEFIVLALVLLRILLYSNSR